MYDITDYTYEKAKKLGVIVVPSRRKNKKIDVYDENNKYYITSVGQRGMGDYPTYIQTRGEEYADKRKEAYYNRFRNKVHKIGSKSWYSAHLLW
jgi:hypothetical protein